MIFVRAQRKQSQLIGKRFYTGNNPEMVCRHLGKLYDSIAKLQWKMDGEKATKFAIVMVAKDGEEMSLYGTCDCSGQVFTFI